MYKKNKLKKIINKTIAFWIIYAGGLNIPFLLSSQELIKQNQVISKAFEIRYLTENPKGNGETDFKGETSIFNTEKRIEYLKNWADYGSRFFNDLNLDSKVVSEEELDSIQKLLKPQPLPKIRKKIILNNWKYLGYRDGQQEDEINRIDEWNSMEGVTVENGMLVISKNTTMVKRIPIQPWRIKATWTVQSPVNLQHAKFELSKNVIVGFREGHFFFITGGKEISAGLYKPKKLYKFDVELDLASDSGRYNFYIDGTLIADFVPISVIADEFPKPTQNFSIITTGEEVYIDEIRIVSYGSEPAPKGQNNIREFPFLVETIIDENFLVRPNPEKFENSNYDDSNWKIIPYERYSHGGERYKEETLYLRDKIKINKFERAVLNIETIRPKGILFINGQKIADLNRHPVSIDISDKLLPEKENLVAIKIDPHNVEIPKYHMSVDTWSGWFAGLIDIELTTNDYIKDVFAYAKETNNIVDLLHLEVKIGSQYPKNFKGKIIAKVFPWLPEESNIASGESTTPIEIFEDKAAKIKLDIPISNPKIWTTKTPNLYKVEVILHDENGAKIDDFVLTTGLRTISQKGGTFRINNQPEVLFGPLLFNHQYPIEYISQWMFSPPQECWLHDILLTKKMNGNTIRMSVHDSRFEGINDRRLAEIGDQIGIMFIWQTPAWIREGKTQGFDYVGLSLYAKALRNHPSIILWQPGNHPTYSFDWYQKVHDILAGVDQSRLISPSADLTHMKGDFIHTIGTSNMPTSEDSSYSVWTSPLLARGTMERVMGYGQDWSSIRNFPGLHSFHGMELDVRMEYLNSKTHAWFDFESEETIGQPNWQMKKGQPYYKLYSYEKDYDIGSIGRILTFEEWKESQAWQAFSAYEAYRKKRWLGFDGMFWCPLRGGGNSATYMKPVVGYQNHVKLGYYALQMAFQPVLAGSKNVDLVYGPDDKVPIMVMNLGEEKIVDIILQVKNIAGKTVAKTVFKNIQLPDGKGIVELGKWSPPSLSEGFYAFEYYVFE